MAQDDFWTRRRKEEEREEEEARERAEMEALKRKQSPAVGAKTAEKPLPTQFDELIKRAPVLIDQLEHLYRQFVAGVLSRPPVEERARLDQLLAQLTLSGKSTAADRFRFSSILQTYNTHKGRWDKLLSDVETGKIKRVAGPRKG
jgi:hypothetical protein